MLIQVPNNININREHIMGDSLHCRLLAYCKHWSKLLNTYTMTFWHGSAFWITAHMWGEYTVDLVGDKLLTELIQSDQLDTKGKISLKHKSRFYYFQKSKVIVWNFVCKKWAILYMSQIVNAYLVSIVSGYCVSRKKPRRIVRGVRSHCVLYASRHVVCFQAKLRPFGEVSTLQEATLNSWYQ